MSNIIRSRLSFSQSRNIFVNAYKIRQKQHGSDKGAIKLKGIGYRIMIFNETLYLIVILVLAKNRGK
ncbi:hypothetical protein CN925_08575 [Bacillus sp. AFS055030]|nr:hypothetical protein CN925_08575 [Bacillus sp. AFS055030]